MVFTSGHLKAAGMFRKSSELNLSESGEVRDSWRMKFIRILFQIAFLLIFLVVFSHPLWADTSGAFLQTDTPFGPSAPATRINPAHRAASTILAGLETGFMGNIVPLAALLLFGRAVWLLIPSRHRSAWRRLAGIESRLMGGKASLAALLLFGRAIWLWIIAPRTETDVVEEKPPVEVPPLRPIPYRITIY
jgi:hypothetical protein